MDRVFTERGFLPERDPLAAFPCGSPLSVLDEIGRDLPSLLEDPGFRAYARELAKLAAELKLDSKVSLEVLILSLIHISEPTRH